jgi:predicted AAA+ superfamily ATPase
MYIERDISTTIMAGGMPAQLLIGPRQCGKSTLLSKISGDKITEVSFDDLQLRLLANKDPKLFLEQFPPPLLIDEVQYAPNIFFEIKLQIDRLKKQRLDTGKRIDILFRLTGSNQIQLDKNMKESLAGRANYFFLNTLTVHEILAANAEIKLSEILFKGGWPELYIDRNLSTVQYLNDYTRTYIEKDIVMSAGIQKQEEFNIVLGLLAARTGMLLDYSNVAQASGVKSVTIKEWASILQRTSLAYCLKPYNSNLNKRLTKTPKFYFLDTGLATRLQGWQDVAPLISSPQAGAIFETLVFAEIFKFIQNHNKNWNLYFWRTKDGEEIDFIITTASGKAIALDAKLSSNNIKPLPIPSSMKATIPEIKQIILVTFSGNKLKLSDSCLSLPITNLHDYLISIDM